MWRLSRNLGASTSWNPVGLSRPVMGLLYPFDSAFTFWDRKDEDNDFKVLHEILKINFVLSCTAVSHVTCWSLTLYVSECDVNQVQYFSWVRLQYTRRRSIAARPLNLPLVTRIYKLHHICWSVANSHSNFPKRLKSVGRINFITDVKSIEVHNNFKIREQQ
jgi:hypothetical protein